MPSLPKGAAAFALLAHLTSSLSAHAEPETLSLARAVQLARERSPELVAARLAVEEARAAAAGAAPLLRENPSINAQGGPRRAPEGPNGVSLQLTLTQTFELGGKQGARREGAKASLAEAQASLEAAEWTLTRDVTVAFIDALYAEARLLLAERFRKASDDLARSMQRRLEKGDVPALDANTARIALARAVAEQLSLSGERAQAHTRLRGLLGVGPAHPISVQGDLRTLVEPAKSVRPTAEFPRVRALRANLAEARANLDLANAQPWPDLSLGVGYEQEGPEHAWLGLLSVPLPLFSRGQQDRGSAAARVRLGAEALDKREAALGSEIHGASSRLEADGKAVQVLSQDALPLVEENLVLARKAYDAGELGLAEFIVIRREAFDAQVDHLSRLRQAAQSRAELGALTGEFP